LWFFLAFFEPKKQKKKLKHRDLRIYIWLTQNCSLFQFFLNIIFSNLMLMKIIWPKSASYNKFPSKHLVLRF
jgi:hypothetical protein